MKEYWASVKTTTMFKKFGIQPKQSERELFSYKSGTYFGVESLLVGLLHHPLFITKLHDPDATYLAANITKHEQFGHLICVNVS